MYSIKQWNPRMIPCLIAVLAHCLLFRLAGQQSFTDDEIKEISDSYIGMRMAYHVVEKKLVLTLQPSEAK